ncbi:hypothetical protein V6N13_114222 [Hibiscus sabdariffa]
MTSAPSLDVSCRKRASTYGGDEFSGKGDGEMAVVLSNAQWGLVFRLLRDGGEVKGNGSPGEGGCLYGTTDGGCLLLGSVFDDGGYVEVLRWGFSVGLGALDGELW